ncbi:uncharacterized protein MONOS_12405 [Monocercomonoides exilis]|uniref:uncharacterized protein n=1 Tax=Monocercomonoides exilis TaxID=2049356 RepID=UPI00355AB4F0|nr:hypothetical protein MONOS_12405 [Monocercomonoides exilis]|eukprot:MONOS_12405.1-p1 / transcript=MONOS_12405.1 / gene=MONOS_12405 / organism=Monocercomonoides_exilis_PA203 / gene_product=unspecified product / transcript_product=unspecified product / location=Mono_scaffold00685:17297-17734(+) / protein_length=118 / sequence_SO=supercontig / SO=protein_coding / is_pseudo=false
MYVMPLSTRCAGNVLWWGCVSGHVGQLGVGGCHRFLSECYLICQAGGAGRSWGCFATEEFFDDPGAWVCQNSGEGDGSNGNGDWEGCSVETRGCSRTLFFHLNGSYWQLWLCQHKYE